MRELVSGTGIAARALTPRKRNHGEVVTDKPDDEIAVFTEQGRWLFEYHDGRSESFCSRAVALLGFTGVILALLLRGSALPRGIDANCLLKTGFTSAVASLLITSVSCLATLRARRLNVPPVQQLRTNWYSWVGKKRRGSAAKDVTEMYLSAKNLDEDSALDWALKTASARGSWFGRAVFFMGLSLASITVVLADVGWQIYF